MNWAEVEATTPSLKTTLIEQRGRERQWDSPKSIHFPDSLTSGSACVFFFFSLTNLVISTTWGLKVQFHSFYTRNTFESVCLQLYQPSYDFNLTDPYCRLLETSYKSLHDPHLKAYHKRKDILRRLKKGGYITSNNKVGWSLLPINQ